MPWKYDSDDDIFEIVLGSISLDSLIALAKKRVTYAVTTPANTQVIDACRKIGTELDLFEVNRCEVDDPEDYQGNLVDILRLIETHYRPYKGIVVSGTVITESITQTLAEKGLLVTGNTNDGFVATLAEGAPIPGLWALTEFLKKEGRG